MDYMNNIDIINKLHDWLIIIGNKKITESESDIENESVIENENAIENESVIEYESIIEFESENRIRKQFLESDEISKTLPMITEKLNNIYTSKPYNITEI
ncbi:1978_t:CDS:2, partial [Gigaspora margarita]